jgi:chaperone required for assembly of F1-ATPase
VPTVSSLALVERPHSQAETDLLNHLAQLETQVRTLQQQLAQLALELLQERTLRYEQRLQTLEGVLHPTQSPEALPQAPQMMGTQTQPEPVSSTHRDLHPAEQRARSRLLPLIE